MVGKQPTRRASGNGASRQGCGLIQLPAWLWEKRADHGHGHGHGHWRARTFPAHMSAVSQCWLSVALPLSILGRWPVLEGPDPKEGRGVLGRVRTGQNRRGGNWTSCSRQQGVPGGRWAEEEHTESGILERHIWLLQRLGVGVKETSCGGREQMARGMLCQARVRLAT